MSAPREIITTNLPNLLRIPFFSGLPEDILTAIAAKLRREHYVKDDVVFVQGGLGNAMYVIESGQVAVVLQGESEEKILSYLGPGSFVGEMALLLGERRSATVRVTIDADLLVLHKSDLDDLLLQYPTIALTFSRELSRRLSFTDHRPVIVKAFNIVAIIGGPVDVLAESIVRQTGGRVLVIKLEGANFLPSLNGRQSVNVRIIESPPVMTSSGLAELLSTQVDQYDWILMYMFPRATEVTLKAMELADITVQMGQSSGTWRQVLAARKHWIVSDAPSEIDPLARRIARKAVGLALSSGSARGIAHVGVLKVLHAEKIPIDLIAGTSAGALFGALYAAGMSIDELIGFALQLHSKTKLMGGLWDFAIPPRSGLIKGHRTTNYLRQFLGNKRFEDLKLPMHIVATDVLSGEEVIFSEGPLVDAVRASISVIGVFAPAKVGSRYLIDGGAVNPVPTSVLAERGADVIIASSVIPSLEDRLQRKQLKREGRVPNVMGVLLGMMEVMESEIIKTRMNPANIVIRPQVELYSAQEFGRAKEFIQLGEEAAYRALDQVKQ
ncbi:MAG: patatin-like phospholipase family protein, partial [Chloroflexota bacterium]